MLPPTPQEISHSSTDERQWQAELEAQRSIWSTRERTVIAGMENYLDNSDDMKLEIELLMALEHSDVNLRYIPTHAKRIFEIFSTKEKRDHLVASRNRWLERQGESVAHLKRSQSDLEDMNTEGTTVKAPPCSERRMRMPLPQQSSSSTMEEESQ